MNPISAKVIVRGPRALTIETLRAQCEIVTIDTDSDLVESHPDDDLLLGYLDAATDHAEKFTGRAIILRTYECALDEFPTRRNTWLVEPNALLYPGIEIPYPPLIEIESFTYTDDSDGELDPVDHYTVDDYGDKAVLRPVSSWPSIVTAAANRVKIRYRAGYSGDVEPDSDAVPLPGGIKAALLLMVEAMHENRGMVPQDTLNGVEALLRPWRVLTGMA